MPKSSLIVYAALAAAALVSPAALAAEAEPLHIGVFDPKAAGGSGARIDGLLKGLNAQGYVAVPIADLSSLTLAQHDVVYLSDVHHPGRVQADYLKTLVAFIEAGGSVLQTWHHHILGQVSVGIQRTYGSRRMHVVPGHPAIAGIEDFDALYKDHIYERVGPLGTPLLKNDDGEVVAVAGQMGKGKVVSTGLALAIPNGQTTQAPRGDELKLLQAFLAWLRPDVPRSERLAAVLREPRIELTPSRTLVATGLPAWFRVRVGCPAGTAAEVTCEGGTVSPAEDEAFGDGATGSIRVFEVVIPTEHEGGTTYLVQAKVGDAALEAYAMIDAIDAPPPPDEVRGVWLHVGEQKHPSIVMPELKRLGLNAAVLRIAGGTAAFYASKVQPDIQDPLAPDGDWMAETVKYARANGIRIYPYVNNCVVEGRSSKETLARLRAAGRLQEDPEGRPINWFCPSQQINIDAIEKPMVELVSRYDVDGVQYDFIRYPNSRGCYCPRCRERFEKESGKKVDNWPADVLADGPRYEEYIEYRCSRISAIVERVSDSIRKANPKARISAAVFAQWPQCRVDVGQDWVRWCEEGWLDFVCPMNYTLDADLFAARTETHRAALPEGFPLVEGIGINSGAGRMDRPEAVAVQVALARKHGAAGFLGFCYQPRHTVSLFEPLLDWLTRD